MYNKDIDLGLFLEHLDQVRPDSYMCIYNLPETNMFYYLL